MWLGLLFGAFAAGASIFQGIRKSKEVQAEIDAEKERERVTRAARIKEQTESVNRGIDYATQAFENEREDAFRKADDIWHQGERIDMRADLDETLTGRAFNLAMQKNNLADESLLLQQQRGKQNFLNRQGAQQTALGMSGARHGANSAEQLLTQNEENFHQDLDLMNRERESQKDINLMQAFTNLKSGMFRIDEERDAANTAFRDSKQLRDDYTGEILSENINDEKEAINKEYEDKKNAAAKELAPDGVFGPSAMLKMREITDRLEEEKKQKIKELEEKHAQKSNAGGRVVKLFNKKLSNAYADLNGNIDLQNLDGGFKQAALDRASERARYTVIDGLTNGIQGFASGWGMGSNISDFWKNWGNGGGGGASQDVVAGAGKEGGIHNLFSDFTRSNALSARRYKDPFGFMFG